MTLHNRIDKRQLKARLKSIAEPRKTLSFYQYHNIADPHLFRDQLYVRLDALNVWGRIYLASEGINAQISIPENSFETFRDNLNLIPFLKNVRLNMAIEDNGKSFFKLKILVRKKILADGLDDTSFDVTNSGKHLDAASFNQLTDDPSTIVVDMRNHYESEVGHFKNARCPDVDTFRDALPVVEEMLQNNKHQNIVMYCTGGIRCEKASAWLKHRGFSHVFQLEGGIISYAQQVNKLRIENKFIGKNFVFDERLGERITHDIISVCHQCGNPCDNHTNCKNDGCHLLFIQCANCAEKFSGCCSDDCKQIIALPQEKQKALRAGINKGRQVFKKGRSTNILFKV